MIIILIKSIMEKFYCTPYLCPLTQTGSKYLTICYQDSKQDAISLSEVFVQHNRDKVLVGPIISPLPYLHLAQPWRTISAWRQELIYLMVKRIFN